MLGGFPISLSLPLGAPSPGSGARLTPGDPAPPPPPGGPPPPPPGGPPPNLLVDLRLVVLLHRVVWKICR